MKFSDGFMDPENASAIMGEVMDMAEAMVQPLLKQAHADSSTNEEYRTQVTKITMALGVGLAVLGERFYKQKAGPELFGQMVGELVKECMEKIMGVMEEVEGNDDTTAEEGSAWSRRRTG